ncbi:hypothetical protein HCN44_003214 [Aphidius gifuensis]|uniref:Protein CUSTOS n=1 Tax=Aphidius gifuensis TaxID=684658 RepID=A0A835CKQ8_APHGI|nr:hypothetical protein HCN44_003214 [Aphidius gifuensis]
MSDSDSSEDKFSKKAIQESMGSLFLQCDKNNESTTSSSSVKASLRINQSENDFVNFGVTKNYQENVAKKLSEILERDIEVEENNVENKKKSKKKKTKKHNDSVGVKLFNESKTILTNNNDDLLIDNPNINNKRKLICKKNNVNLASRCKEAAVDPDWILNKCEIKYWNERPKGLVYKYKKMPNGLLIEQQ